MNDNTINTEHPDQVPELANLELPKSIRNAVGMALLAGTTACGSASPAPTVVLHIHDPEPVSEPTSPVPETKFKEKPQCGEGPLYKLSYEEFAAQYPNPDVVSYKTGKKRYHIDENGVPLYKERYDHVNAYSEGAAVVWMGGKAFHIDAEGRRLYDKRFYYVRDFRWGAAAAILEHKSFHIDRDGEPMYSERFKYVSYFKRDVAWARNSESKWYLIGRDGKSVNGEVYEHIFTFSVNYDYWGVVQNGKAFHVDLCGKPFYEERFDSVQAFNAGGTSYVTKGNRRFRIDQSGKEVPNSDW